MNRNKNKNQKFHIIGAGSAGLACAKFIRQKTKSAEIIVYEAMPRPGGRCYSYYDKKLQRPLDNGTHVSLGVNKSINRLIDKKKLVYRINFFDTLSAKISRSFKKYKSHLLVSIFNTPGHEVAHSLIKTVFWKLFPFTMFQKKIYYSHNDLSRRLIEPLLGNASRIRYGWKLLKTEDNNGRVTALVFNRGKIDIGPREAVICALDARNYGKVFGGPEFDYADIINIHYRTSVELALPQKKKILGIIKGMAHWIFINKDIVSVTISAAENLQIDKDELAREVWKEICNIRGVEPAFVPPYRVLRHRRTTVKMDWSNNNNRPESAATKFSNLFAAGDWTYKNYPCCMEGAVLSAKRAARLCTK